MIIYPRTKCQTVTIKLHSPNFQHSSKCKEYIDGTFTYLPMFITLHRLLPTKHMHICWDTSFDTSFDPIYFFPPHRTFQERIGSLLLNDTFSPKLRYIEVFRIRNTSLYISRDHYAVHRRQSISWHR